MPARTLPETTPHVEFSHVVLRTEHPKDAVDFHGVVLGMKSNTGGGRGGALSHDGEHHRIALLGVPPAPRKPGPGLEHFAWKANSLTDLLGNYKRLRVAGIQPYLSVHHGGTLSFYYRDPDLNQIEIFIDTLTVDQSIGYMHSPEFKRNPVGVPFDPEDLLKRFEEGESIDTLLEQPTATPEAMNEMMRRVIAGMTGN